MRSEGVPQVAVTGVRFAARYKESHVQARTGGGRPEKNLACQRTKV